jgi:cyclic pyranopterin phosphate synthase
MEDRHGRKINYLRLSVTDRCNLRCRYCMPATGVPKVGHRQILRFEELLRIARVAVTMGVEKIRVTGGEPLVRKGILPFLRDLSRLPGLKRLVLTTNGYRLAETAAELRAAGVESLNISLDSLRPAVFTEVTRGGDLNQVLAGIAAAERAGFPFLKLNVVVMRGVNDDEVADFAALTLDKPLQVRFIEYMPSLKEENWRDLSVPGAELLSRLSRHFSLEPETRKEALAGPATYYRIAGAAGRVGVITPVSCHFCRDCNRIRVTASGLGKSCLFDERALDLKPVLRSGNEEALAEALHLLVSAKPDRHALDAEGGGHDPFSMADVGG